MFKQCNTGSLFARQDKEEFGSKNSSQKFLIDVKHHNGHDPSHSPKMRGWGVEEKQGQLNVPCCKTAVGEPDAKKCGTLKYNRRFCRFEGCARVVKSQGLCQRHGAKPCMCKVIGCFKQAQGGCDRMCSKFSISEIR